MGIKDFSWSEKKGAGEDNEVHPDAIAPGYASRSSDEIVEGVNENADQLHRDLATDKSSSWLLEVLSAQLCS